MGHAAERLPMPGDMEEKKVNESSSNSVDEELERLENESGAQETGAADEDYYEEIKIEKPATPIAKMSEDELLERFNTLMEKAHAKGGPLGERMVQAALNSPEARRLRELADEGEIEVTADMIVPGVFDDSLEVMESLEKPKSETEEALDVLKDIHEERMAEKNLPPAKPPHSFEDAKANIDKARKERETWEELKSIRKELQEHVRDREFYEKGEAEAAEAAKPLTLDMGAEKYAMGGTYAKELESMKAEGALPEGFDIKGYLTAETRYQHAQRRYDELKSGGFFSRLLNRKKIGQLKSYMDAADPVVSEGRSLALEARKGKPKTAPRGPESGTEKPREHGLVEDLDYHAKIEAANALQKEIEDAEKTELKDSKETKKKRKEMTKLLKAIEKDEQRLSGKRKPRRK